MALSGRVSLRVVYANPRHRFLSGTRVALLANKVAVSPKQDGAATGKWLFELAPGTTALELRITVPDPDKPASPFVAITQRFKVDPKAKGAPRLVPDGGSWPAPDLHPRLKFPAGIGLTTDRGGNFRIDVDLLFLDVTARVARGTLLRGFQLTSKPDGTFRSHHGCTLRVLEQTSGAERMPVTWLAIVPKALVERAPDKVGVLLFFRPTGDAYTNSDDAQLSTYFQSRVWRYFRDPEDPTHPFYVPAPPARMLAYRDYGFLRQLGESGKPTLFLHPVPHESNYGGLTRGALRTTLNRAVAALWSQNVFSAKRVRGVSAGRLAIAGFSFGGGQATAAILNNASDVSEAYLFDSNRFSDLASGIRSWFRSGDKVLRMMPGGFQDDAMFRMADELDSPDATCTPTSKAFWRDGPLYRAAVSEPGRTEQFDSATESAAKAGSLSARSGLFFSGPANPRDGVILEGRWRENGQEVRARATIDPGSHVEVAGIVANLFLRNPLPETPSLVKLPISTRSEFDAAVLAIRTIPKPGYVRELRHSWGGQGGIDTAGALDGGGTFRGHLRLCLDASRF